MNINNVDSVNLKQPEVREPFSIKTPSHFVPVFAAYVRDLGERPAYLTFKAVLLEVVEPLIWIVQNVFYSIIDCFAERYSLFYTELVSLDQIGRYINQFNQEDHQALFVSPFYCMLDQNGQDWNQPHRGAKSVFDRITDDLATQYFSNKNLMNKGQLRRSLEEKNKPLLAMLINHHHHWTVIHIDFRESTIAYVDSRGTYVGDEATEALIKSRLNQTKQWIEKLDDREWTLKDNGKTPSALHECKQYDWWDCGPFVMELTDLVAKNKSYQDIDQIPFAQMKNQVRARRLHMMSKLATLGFD